MPKTGEYACGHRGDGDGDASSHGGAFDPDCPICNDGYLTPPPETPRGDGTLPFDRWAALATTDALPHVPGYEVLADLGRGGMGVVYQARQFALSRVVALKMIRGGSGDSAALVERLRTEAVAAARLRHPNVVRVYDAGTTGGRPYLVMEYVNGGSLAAHLARAAIPAPTAAALVTVLARAMDYAHQNGVIHRDLKPANVLLELGGEADGPGVIDVAIDGRPTRVTPKVSDFSLAKQLDADDGLTRTGAILGTPCYMSPEQASGTDAHVGPATDIYALGAILYDALTGRPPFRGATVLETLEQVRTADPIPPTRYHPKLPRDLQTICLKCLDKNPLRRYTSAAELAIDLERFTLGRPILARPVGAAEQVVRWGRRRPTAAALVGVCVLAVAAGIVGLIVHNARLSEALVQVRDQEAEARRQKSAALANVVKGHQTLEAIFASLDNAPVGVAGNAAFRAMYEDQANAILRYYGDALRDADAADPEVRFGRGLVSVYAGRMQQRLNNLPAAEADFRRAVELLAPLNEAADAPADYRREWAQCWYWYGTLLLRMEQFDAAAAAFGRADATLTPLRATGATQEQDERVFALCPTRLSEVAFHRNQPEPARGNALEAVDRWDRLIAATPGKDLYRAWKGAALGYLAWAHMMARRWDDLEAVARQADEQLAWYDQNPPQRISGLRGQADVCEVIRYQAHGLLARGDLAAALDRFTYAVGRMEAVVRLDPAFANSRRAISRTYRDRATLQAAAGRPQDALADWDRAVEYAVGELVGGYRVERAVAWLRNGDVERAVEELHRAADPGPRNAFLSAELAVAFARAVEAMGNDAMPDQHAERCQRAADAAAEWLRRAAEGGHFRDREALRAFAAEPPFAALRTRPEWAKRLDELQDRVGGANTRPPPNQVPRSAGRQ